MLADKRGCETWPSGEMIVLDSSDEGRLDRSKAGSMIEVDEFFVFLTLSNDNIDCWGEETIGRREQMKSRRGRCQVMSRW